jgi:hypothetical protein
MKNKEIGEGFVIRWPTIMEKAMNDYNDRYTDYTAWVSTTKILAYFHLIPLLENFTLCFKII